jgi:flagellar hook-length control protein FliK
MTMADPNVKNVSAAQVNKSLAANYSYIKKSSEKTINNSFGNLMQNSLNKMTDSSDKQNTPEKVTVRRSQVEYIVRGAKHTGDGKAVDESTMTGSLKALTGEVKAVVCAVLDMTDEELERYLAENGMCVMDLLLQNNLADFVTDVAADGDSLKLITDSNLSETFSELGDELKKLVATAAQEMDISVEELNKYIQSTDFTDVSNEEPADEVVGTIDKTADTADTDGLLSRRQNNPELDKDNNGSAVEEPELGLEDKITVAPGEDDASQSGTFQKSDESLSGQFLNTLIENVDNAVQAKEDFKGYSVNSENIVRQLVDAIKINVNSSFSEMELQLQPENLGKLNLVIASRDGIITAQFMAENDVVKSAIENQIVMLKDNFEQQGLKVEAVEVMVQTHGFEMGKNLEGRGDNSQDDDDRHRTSRILTLEEINAIIGDDEAADEDVLAAEMLRASGGNVDYLI